MAGAKTEAGNIQDETGTTCNSRKYGNAQKQNIGDMSKEHRSQLKDFLMVKAQNNLSNKISLKVLEVSLWDK